MKNKMYCLIYRLRQSGVANINTRQRTIYFVWDDTEQIDSMNRKTVERLCNEFGFVRQSSIV